MHQLNQQLQQQVLQQQQQLEQQQQSVGTLPNQTTVAMIQHLQQHHQQQSIPSVPTTVSGSTNQSTNTILSHMQLLQQHTPQQIQQQVHQVLQQTGQQLRSITTPTSTDPAGNLTTSDDIVNMLTEQQRCQLFEHMDGLKQNVAAICRSDAAVEDVVLLKHLALETLGLEDVINRKYYSIRKYSLPD